VIGQPLSLVACPSPSSGPVALQYRLEQAGRVRLTVYSASGECVARVQDGIAAAGPHEVRWDARRGSGRRPLAAGVYYIRLETGSARQSVRVVLTR
jgi:flagellar hook assembly protein FlgD